MIITCPQCSARYKVKDGLISEKGKKVKCKKCESVFIAYPDNRSVLKSSPAAPPLKAAESQAQTKAEERPQATVKIDRSKLEGYLKDNAGQIPPPAAPAPAPSADTTATTTDEGGVNQATIQVDRSQIEAFIKKAQTPEDFPAPPDDATVHVDQSEVNAFANETPEEAPDPFATQITENPFASDSIQPGSADTVQIDPGSMPSLDHGDPGETVAMAPGTFTPPPASSSETIKMDTSELPNLGSEPPASPESEPFGDDINFDAPDIDQPLPASPEPIFGQEDPSEEPDFPSDDELGISSPPPPAPMEEVAPPPPVTEPEPVAQDKLYLARVDGKEYPDLTIAAIERWIQEGRLLESDEIDDGGGHARRADDYPEIKPFFEQFYKDHADVAPPEPKKGFFGKLASMFKRS